MVSTFFFFYEKLKKMNMPNLVNGLYGLTFYKMKMTILKYANIHVIF